MLNKLKEKLQKRKEEKEKQKAEAERLSKEYPRRLCFYGQHTKQVEDDNLVYNYEHQEIFLANTIVNPSHVIRLSGKNVTGQPLNVRTFYLNEAGRFLYYVKDTNGIEYWFSGFDFYDSFDRNYLSDHNTTLGRMIDELNDANYRIKANAKARKLEELEIQNEFSK